MANFNIIIEKILKNEGGYVNDPQDPGGETNFGISKRAHPEIADIANLTIDEAKEIYRHDYWMKISGDWITLNAIAYQLFDMSVNAGVKSAVELAQKILNVAVDGILGEQTLQALNICDQAKFVESYKLARIQYYFDICSRRISSRKFLYGWIKRVFE